MKYVNLFEEFMNESYDSDFEIIDIFSTLTRNYESKKTFNTDLLQFDIVQERREWTNLREHVELEKTSTENGFYKLIFKMENKRYKILLDFSMLFIGRKEKDAPEDTSMMTDDILSVELQNVKILRIRISHQHIDYDTKSPSEPIRKSCKKFVIKMLGDDYDTLGKEIYNIEQN